MNGSHASNGTRVVVGPGSSNANGLNAACCDVDGGRARQLLQEPARSLTLDEACYVLVYLARRGEIALSPRGPRFGVNCGAIEFPSAGPLRVTRDPVQVTLAPRVAGVEYRYSGHAVPLRNCDVRLAVFIYKLAEHLRTRWGADRIDHAGVIVGSGRGAHPEGRAIDISGVRGVQGGGPYATIVSHQWGEHRIPPSLLAGVPTGRTLSHGADGAGAVMRPGRPANVWPVWTNGDFVPVIPPRDLHGPERQAWLDERLRRHEESAQRSGSTLHRFTNQRYRLLPGESFHARHPLPPPYQPREMFLDLYRFATAECSDRSSALYHPRPNQPGGTAASGYAPTSLEHLEDPKASPQN